MSLATIAGNPILHTGVRSPQGSSFSLNFPQAGRHLRYVHGTTKQGEAKSLVAGTRGGGVGEK